MTELRQTDGNIDLIKHLRAVQFALLAVIAALLLAVTDTQARFDRALVQLTMLETLATRMVEEPAALQRAFRARIAAMLGSDYLATAERKLAQRFSTPVVGDGEGTAEGLPVDWRVEPYVLVDVAWLMSASNQRQYRNRLRRLPDKTQACGAGSSRYLDGQAFYDNDPFVWGQRVMPVRRALNQLFRFPIRAGNGTEKTVVRRTPPVAQIREIWNALGTAQIWVVDHRRLDRAKAAFVDRRTGRSLRDGPRLDWAAPQGAAGGGDACAPTAPRPPLLKAHFQDGPSHSLNRDAFIVLNFNAQLPAAAWLAVPPPLGGNAARAPRRLLYETMLPARVLSAAALRRDLVHLMGDDQPRHIGDFDVAFPDLVAVLGPILELPPTAMRPALAHLRGIDKSTAGIFGFAFRKSDLQFWGGLALLLVQTYLLVNMRMLTRRMAPDDPAWFTPWVALYPGRLPAALFGAFVVVLPPVAAAVGPVARLWPDPWPGIAGLLSPSVSTATLAALVIAVASLGCSVLTARAFRDLRRRLAAAVSDAPAPPA